MNAFLAASLVKATLLLLATSLVLLILRRASAASRHLVALVGLLAALAVPALGLLIPRWEVPLVPTGLARRLAGNAAALRAKAFSVKNVVRDVVPDTLAGFAGPVGVQIPPSAEVGQRLPGRRESSFVASFALDVARVAKTLWILGALVPLAALAMGFRRASALVRSARPAKDPALLALSEDVCARLGLRRTVPVLFSDEVSVPMTSGLRAPVLLLPSGAAAWPLARQRVVLLHELAHVARRDLGSLVVAEFATASYWFHPLAHLVASQLRRSAEEASDDLVLGDGTRASDYATHLVGIVEGLGAPEGLPVLAMARASDLEERVRAILDPARRRRGPSRLLAASFSAAAVAGALALAALSPVLARPLLAEETSRSTVFVKNTRGAGAAAYKRGRDLHEAERYLEAAESYRKAVELGYRADTAAYNAACAYARAGRKDEAFLYLNKSLELGFDLEKYLREDDDLDSLRKDPRFAELRKAARSNRSAGSEAGRATRSFESLSSKGSKGSRDGARWFETGRKLLNVDELESAEKAFRTAASLGYRPGASTYNAACALARAGKTGPALDTLDAALEAGFDDPQLLGKDDDLESLRDDPRFARLRKKADELTLSIPDVEAGFSRLFRPRGAWREQIPRVAAYVKAHSESGRAQYNLGYAQLLADRPDAAIPSFTRALELGYRKSATLYNLACAEAQARDKEKAFAFLLQAIDAGYDSASSIRNDEDLEPLRSDPRFRKALERAGDRNPDDES